MTIHYDLEDGNLHNLNSTVTHTEDTVNQKSKINYDSPYGFGDNWVRYNNRHNVCPVCSGERRDCRSKHGRYHCLGTNPSKDFEYIKDDSIGFPMYRRISDNSSRSSKKRYDWDISKKEYQKKVWISDDDRAKEFEKVFSQLGLSSRHKQELQKRGLTLEEIDKLRVKSIDDATELLIPSKPGMPLRYGKKFNIKGSGMLIPVWQNGKILGAQFRPDKTNEGSKYFWLKSGDNTSHLEDGKLPLACIKPENIKENGVGICESTGFKPNIAAIKLGKVMIGASGGNFDSSRNQLIHLLEIHHPDKSIAVTLYPDAGANENSHVLAQYEKVISFLTNKGYTVNVATWNGSPLTNTLDIDEYLITGENDIILTNPEDYWKYRRIAKGIYTRNRKFTADIKINEQYLPENIVSKYLKPEIIIAVKSAMGTGKSERLHDVLREIDGEHGLLMLGCRNSTLMEICERLNIYHLRDDDAELHMNDDFSMIANCIDSLPRWSDSNLKNRVIIIDEISSVLVHVLMGATCKQNRNLILEKFEYALKNAHAIILLDANLKNAEVNYIEKLSGFSDVIKIKNDYKPEPWDIDFISDIISDNDITKNDIKLTANSSNFYQLISPISDNKNNIVIVTDSQKQAETIHNLLGINDDTILRIDSKTASTDKVRKFLQNTDNYIIKKGIRILIYSPTIDAGVDIKIRNHFTDMYAFRFHLPTDQFMQMLGRIRDCKCKRHIYSREYSSIDTSNLNSSLKRNIKNGMINTIKNAISNSLESHPVLQKYVPEILSVVKNSDDEHNNTYCQLKSQQNYEKKNLRETLRDRLIESGHNVNDINLEVDKAIKLKYKQSKEEIINKHAKDLMNAPRIDLEEADRILSSWSADYPDRLKAERSVLVNRLLPGIEQFSLWSVEFLKKVAISDRLLILRLGLRWHLQNPKQSQVIQQQSCLKILSQEKIFIPDWRSPESMAHQLRKIGIEIILNNPDRQWKGTDEEILSICKKANHYSRRDYFPRKGGTSPIQYINKILKRIGFKLSKKKVKGKIVYEVVDIYQYLELENSKHELSFQIMTILDKKLSIKANKAQTYVDEQSQSVIPPPINIIKPGEVNQCETLSQNGIEPISRPIIKIGDLVDVVTDKTYGMCEVLEIVGDSLKTKWGWVPERKILDFSVSLVTKIWRYGDDGLRPIWSS